MANLLAKRLAGAIALSAMLAGCAGSGRPSDRERFIRAAGKPVANPSDIVKAELSFARLAQEEGQWTAFRETAAADAIMFVPDLTNAQVWLKGKADPAQAVDWQPHKIHMSCDGSVGVSTGAWQAANGNTGYFTTIWQKQNAEDRRLRGKEVEWKWVFDHGEAVDKPLAEPDFIETAVASCKGDAIAPNRAAIAGGRQKGGLSSDGSLTWVAEQQADGSRSVTVSVWNGTGFDIVVKNDLAPPAK